jgi:hypothetical protein
MTLVSDLQRTGQDNISRSQNSAIPCGARNTHNEQDSGPPVPMRCGKRKVGRANHAGLGPGRARMHHFNCESSLSLDDEGRQDLHRHCTTAKEVESTARHASKGSAHLNTQACITIRSRWRDERARFALTTGMTASKGSCMTI